MRPVLGGLLTLLAGTVAAQGLLPRDVVLLRRVKTHVSDEVAHLPDFTCLETIQRYRSGPGGKGGLKPLDTVRVEVLYSGRQGTVCRPRSTGLSRR